MIVLGYLKKLNRGLGIAFGTHFLHVFVHKNVPYLIICQMTEFQCHTFFPCQGIKQNVDD